MRKTSADSFHLRGRAQQRAFDTHYRLVRIAT
jgi:hypothetical protein